MGVRNMSSQTSISTNQSQGSISAPQNIAQSCVEVSSEQNRYASILLYCSWAAIIFMVVTFILYMAGFLNPVIQPSLMPQYWGMSVHEYTLATHAATGWSWLSMINHMDYLNLIGLAFLGTVSMLGYLSLFFAYILKKDYIYMAMVTLEIVVISLAASGVFRVGE